MKRAIIAAAALATLAGATALDGCGSESKARTAHRGAPTVTVVRPQRRDMVREITLTGDVLGIRQTELMVKVQGFIDRIYADRGDFVKEGALLARLSYPEQEAAYARAKANFDLADANYHRMQNLFEQKVASRQDLDGATANYKAAKETLTAEQTLYGYRDIRAPFDGYIIRRSFDPGHLVGPSNDNGMPFFVIADISRVKVFVYVPEEDVSYLRTGITAQVTSDAYPDRGFAGEVMRVTQGLDTSTRTMQAEIHLANPEGELKPGMFARVTLPLYEHRRALTLPPGAILRGEGGTYVYTVSGARAHRMPVRTGLQDADAVEITDGLGDGAQVVISGWELVEDNSPVQVAHAPASGRSRQN